MDHGSIAPLEEEEEAEAIVIPACGFSDSLTSQPGYYAM
jgi:hypothetical protein